MHDIVFAHPFLKTDDRGRRSLGEVEHLPAKPLAHGHCLLGRSEQVALVAAEIGCHPGALANCGTLEVQIHSVDAFQLEDDIFTLEFRDIFWQSHGGVWLDIQSGIPRGMPLCCSNRRPPFLKRPKQPQQ